MTKEEAIYRLKNMAWLYGSAEREQNIEAIDKAIEALQTEYEDYEHATLVDIKEPLKVAVVRCKDCRWWSCTDSLYQHNSHLCRYWKSTNTSADDFCSYGERREP